MIIKKSIEVPLLTDAKSFYSSDYLVDPSLRPKLVVEYIPAPGTITMTVDETFNRDGNAGSGSVDFGVLSAGGVYYVGDTASPQYAVKLTVESNVVWGLKVSASDDLIHTVSPANIIAISSLSWKPDGPGAYTQFVKDPAETTIAAGQGTTPGASFMYDYEMGVPFTSTSGNYSTSLIYTAYEE